MPDIRDAIVQFQQRYRRAVALRAVTAWLVACACLGFLLWRLRAHGVPAAWVVSLGLVGGIGLVLWRWWAWRRDRLARAHATAELDRALKLDGRLVTAEEFAAHPNPPPLYALLLRDPALSPSLMSERLPRVWDRPTKLLALICAIVIVWPWPHTPPQHLAQYVPPDPPSTESPPTPPSPESSPPSPSHERNQDAASSASATTPASSASADSAAGGAEETPSQSSQGEANRSASASSSSDHGQSAGSSGGDAADPSAQRNTGGPRPQLASAGRMPPAPSSTMPQASQSAQPAAPDSNDVSAESNRTADQQRDSASPASPASSQPHGAPGQSPRRGEPSSPQPARQAQSSSAAMGGQRASSAGQTMPQGGQAARGDSSSASSGQRSTDPSAQAKAAGGSAQETHLRAEMQQLLQELSDEIQQLQAQMATQQPTDSSHPGTMTDPRLYDAPTPAGQATGRAMPIRLDVDRQPTSTTRPGGGVGAASDEIGQAQPQQPFDDVALVDQEPGEEAVGRQAIPPVYQPIFEQLSQTVASSDVQEE